MDSEYRRQDVQGLLRHSHPRPALCFERDGIVSRPQPRLRHIGPSENLSRPRSQLRHSRGKLAPYLIRGWNPSYSRHLLRHSRDSGIHLTPVVFSVIPAKAGIHLFLGTVHRPLQIHPTGPSAQSGNIGLRPRAPGPIHNDNAHHAGAQAQRRLQRIRYTRLIGLRRPGSPAGPPRSR